MPPATRTGGLDERQRERRRLRRVLTGLGLAEALPLAFLAPGQLEHCGLPPGIELANPLVAEESVLRPSLLPGLLAALAYNASHRNRGVGLFEIGHVFLPPPAGAPLPDEREHLGVLLGGADATEAVEVARVLAEALAIDLAMVGAEVPGLHPTRTACLDVDGLAVGSVGEVDPDVAAAHDLDERVGWVELDLDRISAGPRRSSALVPVSRHPSSDIDLAFEVDEAVPADEVARLLRQVGGELVVDAKLFDVYRGDQVAGGRRSLAYALRLQAPDRTLTDADVAEVRQRLIDEVQSRLGATLRG